jgi:HEAT repeats
MNCELQHEWIVAAAYGELADDHLHELERHLTGCAECREEREQVLSLRVLADAYPVADPAPNLIARARLRLDEALDAQPPLGWRERLMGVIRRNIGGLEAVPVAALLLLVVGIGAGVAGGYKMATYRAAGTAAEQLKAGAASVDAGSVTANISSVSSVVRTPGTHLVAVSYKQVVPRQIEGSLDDPQIRQLLMLAAQNSTSAGIRDDSVGLLAAECRAGHGCQGEGIRDALMVALRYDKNAGVRQKALAGLAPYVTEDLRVRNAVLEALLNDSDPKIRSASISMLEPVGADSSVRQVLHSVSNTDTNPYIRNVSRQVLNQVPQIQ